jgi:hypothetical protein
MRMARLGFVAMALLMPLLAIAQDDSNSTIHSKFRKSVSMVGLASDDGKLFLREADGKVWTVENPRALLGHEGAELTVLGRTELGQNKIYLLSVKPQMDETEQRVKWGDSAFRR